MNTTRARILAICLAAFAIICLATGPGQAAPPAPAEVAKAMQARLDKNPADLDAKAQLANALIQTGDPAKAETLAQEILSAQPGHPLGSYVLGNVLVGRGETAKAIAVLRGVRDEARPLVRRAVAQFVTLLEMTESARLAGEALKAEQAGQAAAVAPGSVAVLPYGDLSPEKQYAPLRKALAAMLISDLAGVPSLKVLERVRLQALYDELALGRAGAVDPKTAPRVGRLLGAESVVTGNLGGALTATTSLAGGKGAPATFAVEQAPEKFFQLQKETVTRLMASLGVQPDPAAARSLKVPQTKDLQSVLLFGQGLDALDAGNWAAAADFFKQALDRDPFFDLAAEAMDATPPRDAPTLEQFKAMSGAQRGASFAASLAAAVGAQGAASAAAAASPGAFGCFTRDAQVLMADGSFRPITRLQAGDLVLSYDAAAGGMAARPVVQKLAYEQNHYLLVNGALKLTEAHPLLRADGAWVKAGDVRPGDRLAGQSGTIDVRTIERVGTRELVFNFEVADTHTYLVRDAGGTVYLVHNGK